MSGSLTQQSQSAGTMTTAAVLEDLAAEAHLLAQKSRLVFLAVREIVGASATGTVDLDDIAALGAALGELDLIAGRHRLNALQRVAEATQLRTVH